MTTVEQRLILHNITWPGFLAIADAVGESHVRLTYDRGNLELMTLSYGHERLGELLGQFVVVLTEELDMPRQSGGSTTFKRPDLERGLEPDRCYYLTNAPLVRDKEEIDLTVDPPPDLAIEIEVSRSVDTRLGIYASLRVPEVWRCGETLRVLRLGAGQQYVEADRSQFFPMVPLAKIQEFLGRRSEMDETKLVKSFRQWVRDQVSRGWK